MMANSVSRVEGPGLLVAAGSELVWPMADSASGYGSNGSRAATPMTRTWPSCCPGRRTFSTSALSRRAPGATGFPRQVSTCTDQSGARARTATKSGSELRLVIVTVAQSVVTRYTS